jgi:hypothetical protein
MDFISNIVSDITHRVQDVISGEDHQQHVENHNNEQQDEDDIKTLLEQQEEVEDAAIEAVRQEYANIMPSSLFKAGPVLRYQDINVDQRRWIGSVLIVTNRHNPPRLAIRDPTKSQVGYARGRLLESWEGNHFYRYDVQLSLLNHREKNVTYWFESNREQKWNFFVPALDEAHNWAFYSCNGFTSDVEDPETNFHGANPLWDDLLAAHDAKPFHTMIGGGDQIYNDDVLATPEMVEWLAKDEEERATTEFDGQKRYAVEKYYFDHYIQHYTTGSYSKALSLIPSVNSWDDHDILDGYGSYPPKYQLCDVMQGMFLFSFRCSCGYTFSHVRFMVPG